MRLFLAHPKAWEDSRIDDAVQVIQKLCAPLYPDQAVSVISGRDDFVIRGQQLGWKHWCESVAKGFGPDGQPRFDVFVIPPGDVGKATADMVRMAVEAAKPVVQWDGSWGFVRGKTFLKVAWVEGTAWKNNRVIVKQRLEPRASTAWEETG